MTHPPRIALSFTLLLAALGAHANDFPTVERVLYVQECMRANPGPNFEMVNKCSCALDKVAAQVKFDEYVTISTMAKAVSIGGERGGELRDNETIKPQIARYRELQTKAQAACFIGAGPR
ncbi:hypothetical protein [Aquabacterium sp.]|uniref:hypothetical protein n=1 Tax=Aquabacterium sp. TaxID=1872578 RepID=UPI002CB9656B|nr:hypothetical protein [Aquabacterium sp.]HSW06991.1 hypothetical protein [Aquabacterium sp.]